MDLQPPIKKYIKQQLYYSKSKIKNKNYRPQTDQHPHQKTRDQYKNTNKTHEQKFSYNFVS